MIKTKVIDGELYVKLEEVTREIDAHKAIYEQHGALLSRNDLYCMAHDHIKHVILLEAGVADNAIE